jgi:hypothetical protein
MERKIWRYFLVVVFVFYGEAVFSQSDNPDQEAFNLLNDFELNKNSFVDDILEWNSEEGDYGIAYTSIDRPYLVFGVYRFFEKGRSVFTCLSDKSFNLKIAKAEIYEYDKRWDDPTKKISSKLEYYTYQGEFSRKYDANQKSINASADNSSGIVIKSLFDKVTNRVSQAWGSKIIEQEKINSRKITGRVLDIETKKGINDASILLKGSRITTTNALGYFQMDINPEDTIEIEHEFYEFGFVKAPDASSFQILLTKRNAETVDPFVRYKGIWINTNAVRVDGSRIVSRVPNYGRFLYWFSRGVFFAVDTPSHQMRMYDWNPVFRPDGKSETEDAILEFRTDSMLVITEKHNLNEVDKKNRYTLIRWDSYFNKLRENHLVKFVNDSTILADDLVFPAYALHKSGGIHFSRYLFKCEIPLIDLVSGYFTLDRHNQITEVRLTENRGLQDVSRLIKAIRESSNNWIVPVEGFNFRVPFTLGPITNGTAFQVSFKERDYNAFREKPATSLDGNEINAKWDSFKRAITQFDKGNFDKSVTFTTKALQVDTIFLDAYYLRAESFIKLDRLREACQDLEYLKSLDQVKATTLYNRYCR